MSTEISKATGSFTSGGTWAPISAVAAGELDSEAGSTASTTAFVYSSTFTLAASAADGVAVKVAARVAAPTGTITIVLANNTSAGVREGTLTINVSDLDSNGNGWYLFKFASVTPNGTDVYKVGFKTSVAGEASLFRDGTAGNWARMIRLTAAGSAPAAGDKLMIMGEWTAAATLTSFVVTMDNTATTSFGPTVSGGPPQGLTINKGGTLAWGTAGATNYYLKCKGLFAVFGGGTHQMYTLVAPCPASSSAVLEFDSVANVDSGYKDFAGSNATHCGNPKWPAVALTAASNAIPIEITSAAHGLVAGERVSITGVLGNTAANGTWEVIASTGANTFTIGAINGAVDGGVGTSAGSGAYTSGGTWSRLAYTKLDGDEAAAQTVIGPLLSTSGMAAGDELVFPPTAQTASQAEKKTILTVDSPTQVTLTAGLTNAHSGTVPTRCEVGCLTRNVKIRGVSATLQGYVVVDTTATVAFKDVEFTQLGSATANKRGIDVTTTTGSCSITYCSIHDCTVTSSVGCNVTGAASSNVTYGNNVTFNVANIHFSVAVTTGTWTVDACLFVRSTDTANLVACSDVGGSVTNCIAAGSGAAGFLLSENNFAADPGTFSGNTSHSNTTLGFSLSAIGKGSFTNFACWRNLTRGLQIAGNVNNMVVGPGVIFGNLVASYSFGASANVYFVNVAAGGDTTFTTATGLEFSVGQSTVDLVFDTCLFGMVSGIRTGHTNDVVGAAAYVTATLRNSILGSTLNPEVINQSSFLPGSYIRSQRHDQVAGEHQTVTRYGTIATDTVIFDASSPSVRLTPNNATFKLAVDGASVDGKGGFFVPVASGSTVTVSVRVRQSAVGDGAAYSGNLPRLVLRKKVSAGIPADVVLATATVASAGAWETISGTTAAVTDDCVLSLVVDSDGTVGWVNVDGWLAPGRATSGVRYWLDGEPFAVAGGAAFPVVGSSVIVPAR